MQTCSKLKKLPESEVRVQQVSTDWCDKELWEASDDSGSGFNSELNC